MLDLSQPDTQWCLVFLVLFLLFFLAQALRPAYREHEFERLRRQLQHKDSAVRVNAIPRLVISFSYGAVPLFIQALEDPSWEVRQTAIEALWLLADHRAIEPLIERLKDSHPDVRYMAIVALEKIGDERALPALQWLQENDSGVNSLSDSISETAADAIGAIQQRLTNASIVGTWLPPPSEQTR